MQQPVGVAGTTPTDTKRTEIRSIKIDSRVCKLIIQRRVGDKKYAETCTHEKTPASLSPSSVQLYSHSARNMLGGEQASTKSGVVLPTKLHD